MNVVLLGELQNHLHNAGANLIFTNRQERSYKKLTKIT